MTGEFRELEHFRGSRDAGGPRERLSAIRRAAARFREDVLAGGPVRYYRSFGLVRVPYPTRYGLLNACSVPTPLVHILNRMIVVQFEAAGELKTLLISPSDVPANARTPFFDRLARRSGPLAPAVRPILAPEIASVEHCLAVAGIRPEDVDYLSYDHLHTQDLRRWLGSATVPGYFPRARLLVMRAEWESARALLPPQADWYCPGGLDGVPPERVILLDADVSLGAGMALMRTPGHTMGNHSFVVATPEGPLVTSENGISADSYAPLRSRIPGVRRYALQTGMEVVLNGNTLEGGLDQYLSMIQEKEVAGASVRDPDFYNVVPSSELAAYWAFPGIAPTFAFGELSFGQPAAAREKVA